MICQVIICLRFGTQEGAFISDIVIRLELTCTQGRAVHLRCFRAYIRKMKPMTVTTDQQLSGAASGSIRSNGPFAFGACSELPSHYPMGYLHQVSPTLRYLGWV